MATRSGPHKSAAPRPPTGGSGRSKDEPKPPRDPVVQVRIVSNDVEAFKKYVASTPLEFACATPRLNPQGVVSADVLMKQSVAERAERPPNVKVEIVADLSATTGARRAEVGRGNRFADSSVLPKGRGKLIKEVAQ